MAGKLVRRGLFTGNAGASPTAFSGDIRAGLRRLRRILCGAVEGNFRLTRDPRPRFIERTTLHVTVSGRFAL